VKSIFTTLLVCFMFVFVASVASAASIDGKWALEMKMPAGKKGGGEGRTLEATLDLKSSGSQLTGSMTMTMRQRERTIEIQDGKIEGDKFSFTTMQRGRQGEMKIIWEGTVSGDELKGERKREGAPRGVPFTAKRQ
jgi:hypothetical protein